MVLERPRDLLQWHPHLQLLATDGGFAPSGKRRLVDTAAYLVRNPLSLNKLVYLDGHKAVSYRSWINPSLGRNFEALDPLEWLARMSDHIPDPGQHRTILYGHYANRVRGQRQRDEAELRETPTEQARRGCSASWARLIAKIYQVDPLVCSRCGQQMIIIAFLTDAFAIDRILDTSLAPAAPPLARGANPLQPGSSRVRSTPTLPTRRA